VMRHPHLIGLGVSNTNLQVGRVHRTLL